MRSILNTDMQLWRFDLLWSYGKMTTKTIDAVKLMRELRDELGRKMADMSSRERIEYVRKLASTSELGKSLEKQRGESNQR